LLDLSIMRNNWKIITFVWSGTLRLNSVDGAAEMLLNVIGQVCSLRVWLAMLQQLLWPLTCTLIQYTPQWHLLHAVSHCPCPCWQASAAASHALPSRLQSSLTKTNTVVEAASFPVPTVPHASAFQCLSRLLRLAGWWRMQDKVDRLRWLYAENLKIVRQERFVCWQLGTH